MATVRDFVRKTPAEAPGPAHPCDAPGLTPLGFLLAVMHDPTLPIATRIKAASAALPLTESVPRSTAPAPSCTIIIGGLPPCHSFDHPPIERTEINSQTRESSHIAPSHSGEPQAPVNLTRYPDPPTPTELQEIKAAVNRLRPDLAHLPVPEPRLCACGHWIFGPCPLGERCCDRTKLN
jgi:hypothetical protein